MDSNVQGVIDQLTERAKVGFSKYGVTTERTDLSTKQWLQHLQEELMDSCVYLERIKRELE
jgi:hypothetical protein